jgi:alpha-1,3-rhamnosyl/mannosyltransferase
VRHRVRFLGYVTDRQLAALYRCSTAFVFPSLYEGFGLPALEAMAHGVPIACSDTGALPEVCGDAAVLFDPMSVDSMVGAIDQVLRESHLRARLSAAGIARSKEFDWRRTAERTLEVYRSVAAHSSK